MKKSEIIFGLLRIPLDAAAVFLALIVSYQLRAENIDLIPRVQLLEPAITLPVFPEYVRSFVLLGVFLFFVIAVLLRLYLLRVTFSAWTEVGSIVIASVLWLVLVMAWYFLVRKELFYSRILLVHGAVLIAIFVMAERAALVLLQRALLRAGIGVRAVASVGGEPLTREAVDLLERDPRYRYLGHCPDFGEFELRSRRTDVDLVLQTDPNPRSDDTRALIEYCRSNHIGYAFLPAVLAHVPHQLRVEHLGLLPLLRFQPTPLDGWGRVCKRLFDLTAGVALLMLLWPLFLVIAFSILLDGGWPVFYVSRRVGEYGKVRIPVMKFRSMVRDADAQKSVLLSQSHRSDGPLFKVREDPRVTRVGRFLRRWSFDELPQLFNVLVGRMSLVGPRPHLPDEVDRYSSYERRVFAVKPGVTGLAQISGRSDLAFEEEVRLDLRYIEEWSFWLDLWILWRTIFVVLGRRGAD